MIRKINLFIIFIVFSLCFLWGCTSNENKDEKYLVTYNLMGGSYNDSTEYPVVEVKQGDTIENITPIRNGFIFKGWTNKLDDSMTGDYDFDSQIVENTVLYAVWHRPQIQYNLNEGYFTSYNSIDVLIDDFMNDYISWRRWGSFRPNEFVDYSWHGMQFFSYSNYGSKWDGLLYYLANLSSNNSKSIFENFINSNRDNYSHENDNNDNEIKMRYEIQAFLTKSQIINTEWPVLTTADYSNSNILDSLWKYFIVDSTNFYDNSSDYYLAIPHRDGYVFEGWYETADFNGEAVQFIPQGTEVNKTFYAKWRIK